MRRLNAGLPVAEGALSRLRPECLMVRILVFMSFSLDLKILVEFGD